MLRSQAYPGTNHDTRSVFKQAPSQLHDLLLTADVTKHAVLGKFNEIRPGVYREFMKDVCEKARILLLASATQ